MKRNAPEHPEIIYRPDLQPRGRRALFSGITFLAWLIWFYLFLPLLSVGAWWFGFESFRHYMLDPGRSGYLVTLSLYMAVIAATALLIIGWSRYNQIRFGGPDRRKAVPPVSSEMLQQRFGLDARALRVAQEAKVIEVDLGEGGRLRSARVRRDASGKAGNGETIWSAPTFESD